MKLMVEYLYKVGTNCLADLTKKQGFSRLAEKKKEVVHVVDWQ